MSRADQIRDLMAAADRRYEERFQASQVALGAALLGQKEATAVALAAAEKAVNAALLAADRAVAKAETAAEKRFESVNEFRSTLADQQRTLMPRNEAELIFKSLREIVDANHKDTLSRLDEAYKALNGQLIVKDAASETKLAALQVTLSGLSGAKAGARDQLGWLVAIASLATMVVAFAAKLL